MSHEERKWEREAEEKRVAELAEKERVAYEKREAENLEIRRRACGNAGCRQADEL